MRAIVFIVCGLIGLGALAGCGSEEVEEGEPEASGQTEPGGEGTTSTTETNEFGAEDAEAARLALEGVINRDIGDPDYHVSDFRNDPALSADLIAQIEQLTDEAKARGATALDFDPFVCAQQIPTKVSYNQIGVAGERITFNGILEFGPTREKITYVVIRDVDDKWKLDATECVDAALPKGE